LSDRCGDHGLWTAYPNLMQVNQSIRQWQAHKLSVHRSGSKKGLAYGGFFA
jgi:hypothetical protein